MDMYQRFISPKTDKIDMAQIGTSSVTFNISLSQLNNGRFSLMERTRKGAKKALGVKHVEISDVCIRQAVINKYRIDVMSITWRPM